MSPQAVSSTLGSLRKAGSVFGVLFSGKSGTIYSDLAYTPERVSELVTVLDDIDHYFRQEHRSPEVIAFGFDGGNLVTLWSGGCRLVVLYHHADEVDFIAKAGGAFMKDFFAGEMAKQFVRTASRRISASDVAPSKAPRKPVDPTTPIAPVTGA